MKMPLKDTAKRHIARAATAFGIAAGSSLCAAAPAPPPAPPQTVPQEPTLWKTQEFDAVVQLTPCTTAQDCARLYWVNTTDARIYEDFGDKSRPMHGQNGVPDAHDIAKLCGFSPRMEMHQDPQDKTHWQGEMDLRGRGMTVNVDARLLDKNHLRVKFSKAIFSHTETWTRVEKNDPRYPACARTEGGATLAR